MLSSKIQHSQLIDSEIYRDLLYVCSALIQKHENDPKVLVLHPPIDEDSSTGQNVLNKHQKVSVKPLSKKLSVSVVKQALEQQLVL